MLFDLNFFLVAVPAMLIAGMSKGGFGSGAGFAVTPILALILPPELAVGIMLPLLMVMDVAALRPYWRLWSSIDSGRLILGGVPGVLIGAAFWTVADAETIRLIIGVIALAFVGFQLARKFGWLPAPRRPAGLALGLVAGCASGFTSFVSHAGGPPATVYLLSRGLTKTSYQATMILAFWAINLLKAVFYSYLGIFSVPSLTACLYLAPVALVGVWVGVKAHHAISERAFFGLTIALLGMTGAKLVLDALT